MGDFHRGLCVLVADALEDHGGGGSAGGAVNETGLCCNRERIGPRGKRVSPLIIWWPHPSDLEAMGRIYTSLPSSCQEVEPISRRHCPDQPPCDACVRVVLTSNAIHDNSCGRLRLKYCIFAEQAMAFTHPLLIRGVQRTVESPRGKGTVKRAGASCSHVKENPSASTDWRVHEPGRANVPCIEGIVEPQSRFSGVYRRTGPAKAKGSCGVVESASVAPPRYRYLCVHSKSGDFGQATAGKQGGLIRRRARLKTFDVGDGERWGKRLDVQVGVVSSKALFEMPIKLRRRSLAVRRTATDALCS